MATLNKVMLIGRLTDNPEAPRTLPNSGSTVIRFRFAVGRSKKNPETGQWENDPNPLYIDCEAFHRQGSTRNLVDLIQKYCKKGDPLFIEGRLQLDQWEDKNGGGKRSKHKVVVESVELLGSRSGDDSGGGGRPMGSASRGNTGRPANNTADDRDDFGGGGSSGGDADGGDIPF
jgi:single-strand DNA-binding protein